MVLVDAEDDDTKLTVNGESVGGTVELPMVGLDEPVTQSVAPAAAPSGDDGADAGSAGVGA